MKTLARLALAHPLATLGAALAATLAFGSGLPRLETEVGYRAFLGAHHPSVRRFDAFLARYEGGLPLAVVYTCEDAAPCRTVFDPPALEMARAVSDAVAAAPGVRRVDSPARAPVLLPGRPPRPPLPRRFFENGALAPDHAALAARARIDRLWRGSLVSEDARTGALLIEVEDSRGAAAVAAWSAVERAIAPYEAQGYAFCAVGGPVEFVVAGGELERATRRLVPVMVLLVAGGLALLLRSPAATAALLGTIGLGVLWTHGLLGWLGFGQNTITQILAPVLLVIGTCDGLHLIARFAAERAESGASEPEALAAALLRAVDDVAAPCLMMTLTTAGGFLAFLSSDLAAFARFGAIAAFGIGCSLVLTFSVLPVLLVRFPPPPGADTRAPGTLEHGLLRLARAVRRRSGAVLVASALLAAAAAVGVRHLPVDATFEDLYGERSRVVQWVAAVRERLRQPDSLELELTAPPGTDLASPEALGVLERVVSAVEGQRHVGRVRSLLDPLSWMNRLWTGDDPRLERPAATARANHFLLDLLARDPGGGPVRRFADLERGRLRVSLETAKPPRSELGALIHGTSDAVRGALPPGWSYELTGPVALVHDMIEAIQRTQISSFLQAWATVAVLVTLFLRSLASGLLVALTTALPVAATLGAMGLLRIPLDPGSAMVAAVVLGISDDDAIHFLTQYRRTRADGLGPGEAIEAAIVHTGRAMVTTSLALALGFSTLGLSPWKSVASFGLLSALAILAALGAVLIVLPAAIHTSSRLALRKGTDLRVK